MEYAGGTGALMEIHPRNIPMQVPSLGGRWGLMYDQGVRCQTKRLDVKPGGPMSDQEV